MSIPTIDDLRVKQCYICRDEEHYDAPENPPRAWVHPCKCTLIAHQSCLMESILKKPGGRDTNLNLNTPKCPQCGFEYQIERSLPLLASSLVLTLGDTVMHAAGMGFFTTSLFGLGALTVGSLIAVGTGYGAVAVREFFGQELFDLLLTDNPSNWSWTHCFLFPLTPIRLSLTSFESLGGFIPFFFLWPSAPPASSRMRLLAYSNRIDRPMPSFWPPSIYKFGFIVLGTTIIYNESFHRFSHWLLGTTPPKRTGFFKNFRMRREFRRQIGPGGEDEREAILEIEHRPDEEVGEQALPDGDGGAVDGPGPMRDTLEALDGVTQYANISVCLGLLKPFVASGMGRLLYLGAQHSSPLRYFLGIQPHAAAIVNPSPRFAPELLGGNTWYWDYLTEHAVQSMDPVWIRNSIGLGIFVVFKDCIHLFHLWLAKRELASRRLKNRDFSGVDPKALDLIQRPTVPS